MDSPYFSSISGGSKKMRRRAVSDLAGKSKLSPKVVSGDRSSSVISELRFSSDRLPNLPSVARLGIARGVLAATLPVRYGLWWACLCIEDAMGESTTSDQRDAVLAVARYVIHPTNENRRRMASSRQTASPIRIAGLLACQALDEQGLIDKNDSQQRSPKHDAVTKLIGSTVCQAAFWRAADDYQRHLFRYLELGLRIGLGQVPWPGMGDSAGYPDSVEIHCIAESIGLKNLMDPSFSQSLTEDEILIDRTADLPARLVTGSQTDSLPKSFSRLDPQSESSR